MVIQAQQKLGTSERRTCQAFWQGLGIAHSTLRYEVREASEDELRLALISLAKQYDRYGNRKVGQLLQIEGWYANHKKVERIWREEELQLPKRRKRLYRHEASFIRVRPNAHNYIWPIVFVHDKLSNHRPYKRPL